MNRSPCLVLALALALPGSIPAKTCTIDEVPAATLLLPYFEVDLARPTGITTLLSVNNASNGPVLVKAEVWTDLGVPIFGFNVYLSGFDVQTINLHDIFVDGRLPQTQKGPFASCTGQLPPPPIPAALVADYRRALTGKSVALLNNACAGRVFRDNIARGYITIDTVNNCTLRFPGDPGYFSPGGTGDATNQNVLWGDYSYVNQSTNLAEGSPLVHIEANAQDPETSVAGQYTFYGKFVNWTGADNREPLPTTFGVRYLKGAVGTSTTTADLIVWRDSKVNQNGFKCGTLPSWYPLGQERIEVADEAEHHYKLNRKPFPAVAQRVRVGPLPLPTRYPFGWMHVNLNTSVPAAGANPPEDPAAAQAWVSTVQVATTGTGKLSIGYDALQIDNACSAHHAFP